MYKKSVFVFFLFIIFSIKSSYSQCAMCKAVVQNGDQSIAEGVNNGISYLMIFPYLLIGGLFYTLYKYKRRTKN